MKKVMEYLKNKKNRPIIITCAVMTLIIIFQAVSGGGAIAPLEVSYVDFTKMVEESKVSLVKINLNDPKFEFQDIEGSTYKTTNPKTATFKEYLLVNDISVEEMSNSTISMVLTFAQTALYILFLLWIFKRVMPQTKTEDIVKELPNVTFDDIAGEHELKKDLQFAVEYLKNPERYLKIGARMPRGIVLYGPPGTGKTLTAKALAGTAKVPFYSVSGSDFVEMYVGLGAKRVRELFKKAREHAPCIIFIDEIDAVGTNRGINGDSEKDRTINALLNELDGFNGKEGILTICATNRLEDLDKALIRPGRFDKQLAVPLPEREDRIEILNIHTKGKAMGEDVDYSEIAAMTVGFSGAALEAMLNEAAFVAVQDDSEKINMSHVERAFYKIIMKGDQKGRQNKRDKKELEVVAYHEAGHAIATKLYTDDNVPKITILSYTSGAGGATFRTPQEIGLRSRKYLLGCLKMLYAGRAAEQVFLQSEDEITTGASNDIEQATYLLRDYITAYGMNDKVGLVNILKLSNTVSPDVLIEEASKLSLVLYEEVREDLYKYRECLEELANKLLEEESISESVLDEILLKHDIITIDK